MYQAHKDKPSLITLLVWNLKKENLQTQRGK